VIGATEVSARRQPCVERQRRHPQIAAEPAKLGKTPVHIRLTAARLQDRVQIESRNLNRCAGGTSIEWLRN